VWLLQDYETAPGLKDTPFFMGEAAPAAKAAPKKAAAKVGRRFAKPSLFAAATVRECLFAPPARRYSIPSDSNIVYDCDACAEGH